MTLFVFSWFTTIIYYLISWIAIRLFLFTLFLSVAHACGLLQRFLCFFGENLATSLLNGTKVTIGCFTQTDFIHGKFAATNLVIHAPHQQQHTTWQAPLIARMGHVYLEVNIWQWIACFLCFGEDNSPLDFYSVEMSDVQFFVERQHGVYNFFFLDPTIVLPPAPPLTDEDSQTKSAPPSSSLLQTTAPSSSIPPSTSTTTSIDATAIVDDLLDAVRRAAQEGTPDTLVTHYRHRLLEHMRDWRGTADALRQGLLVAVRDDVSVRARHVVQPERRVKHQIVLGRVGMLRIRELHIFMEAAAPMIRVGEFGLKPSELLASNSAVFTDLDDIVDVVVKRLVAEIAKSNTGLFLQTAMQEMADAMRERK